MASDQPRMTQFLRTPQFSKALAIGACIGILLFIHVSNPPYIPQMPNLDISWLASLPQMLDQGQISGRDFYFTYGPITQVINWLATRITISDSPLLAISLILLTLVVISWGMVAIILWLSPKATWKTVVFVYAAYLIFVTDWTFFRTSLALVVMAILAQALSASRPRHRVIITILTGAAILIAQLVILDLGIYTILSSAAILTGYIMLTRLPERWKRPDLLTTREYGIILGTVLLTVAAGNIAIAVIYNLTSPAHHNLFDYQRYGLESIQGYNLTMAFPWGMTILPTLALFTLGAFCIIWFLRTYKTLDLNNFYLFSCFMAPALLIIKSALVRSDLGHILLGFQPLVFVFIMIGGYLLETQKISKSWLAMAALVLAIWPATTLNLVHSMATVLESPITYARASKKYLTLEATSDQLLPKNFPVSTIDPDAPLLAFPYENDFAIVLGHKIVAPVLQSYAAHTPLLQQKYVDLLQTTNPTLEIVYGMDAVVSGQIDNVQQVTRVPIIFEYIYRNFALKVQETPSIGFYILERRATSRDLNIASIDTSTQTLDTAHLRISANTPSACGLIRLTVRIDYPIWIALGRTNPFQVDVFNGDALIRQLNLVAIETGHEFSTYISITDPAQFYQVFSEDPNLPAEWTSIEIKPFATGYFGVDANNLNVAKVECLEL